MGWIKVKLKDGNELWAHSKKPTYFYSGDVKKGDKTGAGIGDVWHI